MIQYNYLTKKIILLLFLFFAPSLSAQDELLKGFLKSVDVVNQEVLKITELSDEDENAIGKDLDKKISKEFKPGKEIKFNVKKIFDKIKKNVTRKKINYRYSIVNDTTVNAFTIAGGKIYILTGILNFLDTEDELAFVIAHELAHNELKQCIKKVQYSALASKVNPHLGEIVQVAYSVYSVPFTKYEEYDADELGVKLMLKAGYKVEGAVSFFDKLKKLEDKYKIDKRDALNDFISSHPVASDRKEKIKNKFIK